MARHHPVLILVIIVVGEHLFGLWGLLLGGPVAVYSLRVAMLNERTPGIYEPAPQGPGEKMNKWSISRYGGGFIVLARFVDGPRQLNSIIAGTLAMRWWVFTAFYIVGAVLWAGIWGRGTWYVFDHVHAIDAFIRQLNAWVSGIVVLGVLASVVYLLLGRRTTVDRTSPNAEIGRENQQGLPSELTFRTPFALRGRYFSPAPL